MEQLLPSQRDIYQSVYVASEKKKKKQQGNRINEKKGRGAVIIFEYILQ